MTDLRAPSLAPGSLLGRYEILAFLGHGGLGEVYRARDSRLERDVSLKLLPADLFDDEALATRFEKEVRVLATLEHPHLAAMYGLERSGGRAFLVMEFVPGELLADRLRSGGLGSEEATRIFRGVAEALERAHAHGIAHLDINPSNIVVPESGGGTVVDFALAPVRRHGDDDRWLSPEQRAGARGDERSDVWAFGRSMLEAVAGSPEAEPLVALARRCTAEAPDERPTMVEVHRELRREEEAEASGPAPVARSSVPWAALALLTAGVSAALWWTAFHEPTSIRLGAPTQLSFAVGVEEFPSWSPDGSRIAFDSNQSGNWDVWMARNDGGDAVDLTSDHPGDDRFPSWSPDGDRLAFWSSRNGGGVFVLPASGGEPRFVAQSEPSGSPSWLRGGSALSTFVEGREGQKARIVALDGTVLEEIELPGRRSGRLDATWSRDERLIAYVDALTYDDDVSRLRVLRVDDGAVFDVTDGLTRAYSPSWSPDRRSLYYVSNQSGPMDLWRQSVTREGEPDGAPERVTTGVEVRNASFAFDWKRLAYSKGRRVANVWRVPVLRDRPATWADAEQLTFDNAYVEFIDVAPDGTTLALSSNRSGNPDLWRLDLDERALTPLTTEPSPDWSPNWSPDGARIAFYAYRTGNRDVWVMDASGGSASNLTEHEAEDFHPVWSPDGSMLAFSSVRSGTWALWCLDLESSEAHLVTTSPGDDRVPQWSPDGEWLYFDSRRGGEWALWRVPSTGGEPERITEGNARMPALSPDGTRLFFIGAGDRTGNLWELSLSTGRERPVTDLRDRRGGLGTLALATDGSYVYFVWGEDLGDLWLMELE